MERTAYKAKLLQQVVRGEMKRVANTSEPHVVIPVIVVLVHVEVPIIVIAVEDRVCVKQHLYHYPLSTLGIESNLVSLYRTAMHQVASFFEVSAYITLS